MTGEIVVAGLVTGTHIIEDIGVAVPHQIAVTISANLALQSKDLWRGIQQGKLFKLDGGTGFHVAGPPSQDTARVAELEEANRRLKLELSEARSQNDGLHGLLQGLQTQLQGIHTAVGRLEAMPRVVNVTSTGNLSVGSDVVGGEAPAFLPDRIRPETAEAQIRSEKETGEKANVSSAASKLRELKKQTSSGD